jgi:hypothetical protein
LRRLLQNPSGEILAAFFTVTAKKPDGQPEQTNQFVGDVQVHMDNSDRFIAGMSDFLRNQTVIVDTQEGGHPRTSDQLADLLMQTNPNQFQAVPTSQYIRGIDY